MADLIACLLFDLESGPQHPFAELQTLLLVLEWNTLPDVAAREGETVLLL